MKLQPGDNVYRDPQNQNMGKCLKCKRHSLVITKAPDHSTTVKPKGFWRVPTE